MSPRLRRGVAAAALAIPILAWSVPFLPRSRSLWGIDFHSYFRPHFALARDSWVRDGELPRWNPSQYAGAPYLGNLQDQIFYPPNWIALAVPLDETYEILILLHLLLAAWGTYRLARGFRVGRAGSVIAGLAFALSVSSLARVVAGHLPNLVAQSLAPMWLHLLLRLWRRPAMAGVAGLSAWTGLLVSGGTTQWIYHVAMIGAGAIAWKLVSALRERRPWRASLAGTAAAGALGLLLSAATWLPAIEVSGESTRGEPRSFYSGLGVGYQQGLTPQNLLHVAVPWVAKAEARLWDLWWHEKALYVGVLPLVLALAAAGRARRGPMLFFAVIGAVALLDAMTPLHAALAWLPGYGKFRVPARSTWVAVLALSVLSGFGWDLLRTTVTRGILIAAGIAAAAAVTAAVRFSAPIEGGAAVVLALVSLGAIRWGDPRAAVLLAAVDLCVVGLLVQKSARAGASDAAPWYEPFVGPERREFRLLDATSHDAAPVGRGFRLLNGYGHPLPRRTVALYARAWEDYAGARAESLSAGTRVADPEVLASLNVRWIVSRSPGHPRWREVARSGERVLYEDPGVRPLAFAPGAQCTVARVTLNRLDVRCRAAGPTSLTVSEAWMPGWRATVDGREAPVRPADDALLSVDVPAGESIVSLNYDPPAGRTGLRLTAAGLMATVIVAFAALVRRRP